MAMLTITADDGAQGFSFAPPEVVRPFVVNTFFRKVLVGQDPFNRERIWQDLNHWQRGSAHQLTERALSFIEQALWDLIGRSLKMPVYKLLGGYRDTVPAYGSTMCGDDLPGRSVDPGGVCRLCRKAGRPRLQGHQAAHLDAANLFCAQSQNGH
ncbi:putative mandelate racemase / muconate lactonizing enzyme [Klebsiella michiganensis]|uniref:Putative mandelate racemase / muconate lactonizing enzyme n=1 Tax=Klebsiella michiganensis TaxID=1134687 RepID=A0A7H4PQ06_9ENTR|nr:putative mandelate racemase / muconate lactonizing enzyme [Klebsiella michiganensis]